MKNFVRRIRNIGKSGSTLIAVMVVTTILSIFLITLQPIMLNYAQRSIDERDLKQAEFTARSANDAIVKEIVAGNATLIAGINSIVSDGSSLVLNDFTFSSSQMGSAEAKIQRISTEEFSVVTRATVNGAQRTIGRVINKVGGTGGSSFTPLPAFYFHNISNIHTTGNKPVVVNGNFTGAGGTDIYISGDLYILDDSSISFTGNAYMSIGGNFYTQSGTFILGGNSSLIYKGNTYDKKKPNVPTLRNSTVANTIASFNAVPPWVETTGTSYTSSLTLNGGSYYVMNGSNSLANITNQFSSTVTTSNPVYIILRTGSTLSLSNAIDPPVGGVPKDPRIVLILEGNATLNLQHLSSVVVYGTELTSLEVNASSGNPILYGQVRVGNISYSGSYVTLNYRSGNTSTTNPGTVNWEPGNYKKATY